MHTSASIHLSKASNSAAIRKITTKTPDTAKISTAKSKSTTKTSDSAKKSEALPISPAKNQTCVKCSKSSPSHQLRQHKTCKCILCCSCLLNSLHHHFNTDSQPKHGQIICPICMQTADAFLDFADSNQIEIEEPIILSAPRFSGDTFNDALRDATIYAKEKVARLEKTGHGHDPVSYASTQFDQPSVMFDAQSFTQKSVPLKIFTQPKIRGKTAVRSSEPLNIAQPDLDQTAPDLDQTAPDLDHTASQQTPEKSMPFEEYQELTNSIVNYIKTNDDEDIRKNDIIAYLIEGATDYYSDSKVRIETVIC